MTLRFELQGTKASAGEALGTTGARTGRLVISRESGQPAGATMTDASIVTPNYLKYTRHGLQPHMVREVAAKLEGMPAATRVQVEDFLADEMPDYGKLSDGMHAFIGLDRSELLVLDTLDPTVAERTAKSSNTFLGIDSEGGTRRLTAEVFARLADQLKPDVVVPLADYIEEPRPSLTQGKRISKSVTRSCKWLEEYLSKRKYPAAVFAPVMGSHSTELRDISAKKLAALDDVAGYVFNDVSLDVAFEKKLQLVGHSLAQLDASKPRYMVGASAPDSAVRAILCGIDLVDSSYPYAVTEQGFASTYVFGGDVKSSSPVGHVDLWQESMFSDFGPLVEGCKCFTCSTHHRSYIHHLLMTKEMLSTVLLQIHNMHWYQRFFEAVRESLAHGRLEQDAKQFLEHYCNSGCNEGDARCAAFGELETLYKQECSPTTKIQRKRHAEQLQ
ncbi:hypothetical protein LPJ73_000146 [Coemansia sp. RSA 2703]|nr:hypothetical protein LPJ73_000146 [Coemansia sp. RSA 2703]KAJ2379270.1 hypothetical protein IW150_000276 [Coemansia sp. RSA 2607]KAJ2397971.1 hypothetical protein GGI05_000362 [Coemansia sp. RSA 2603]